MGRPVRDSANRLGIDTAVPVEAGADLIVRRRPPPLNALVSAQMQRMPRASTGPEVVLRRALHRRGLRFRVAGVRLPGRPDIIFPRARLAVFVDGCFWHRCPQHGTLPKNNADWWLAKLDRNVERDREKDAALAALGWEIVHVWEHEDMAEAATRIAQLWRERCAEAGRGAPSR